MQHEYYSFSMFAYFFDVSQYVIHHWERPWVILVFRDIAEVDHFMGKVASTLSVFIQNLMLLNLCCII